MHNPRFLILIIFLSLLLQPLYSLNAGLASHLKGRILLQVESKGEAWYVHPISGERYFLGRPNDAFGVMRELGLGISNADFDKINAKPTAKFAGRIILKIQDKGKAYYINPATLKIYFLGRPDDAFKVMRDQGIGIKNSELEKILIASKSKPAAAVSPRSISIAGKTYDIDRIEALLIDKLNQKRVSLKLAELAVNEDINELSRYHSKDMAENDYFEDKDKKGCDMACRLESKDFYYKKVAESLASGYVYKYRYTNGTKSGYKTDAEVADSLFKIWADNKYVTAPEYGDIGLGIFIKADGKVLATLDLVVPIITASQEKELKNFAQSLVSSADDDKTKIYKIHDWIIRSISYDYENYAANKVPDESYEPYGTFKNRKGVCQGYAQLLRLFLKYAGIDSSMVRGTSDSSKGYTSHAWNSVRLDGQTFYIDSTWNAGYIINEKYVHRASEAYYLIPSACIQVDHAQDGGKEHTLSEQKQYVIDNSDIFSSKCSALKKRIENKSE